MSLTLAQLQTLKADILANPDLNAKPNTPDGAFEIAALYNMVAVLDFWVWRTSVFEQEYTRGISVDGTAWNWTTYIGRSQGERDAWARLFMGGGTGANPSLSNVRQAVADIFSGAGGVNQRTHLLTVSRRKATRGERLFATGEGSTSSPATMTVEGLISTDDVNTARNLS